MSEESAEAVPGPGRFPSTRHSVILSLRSGDPQARRAGYESLVRAYWKPIYKYLRLRWHCADEDAKDLTQAFLARAMEKSFFDPFDPARARFRTYLRVCIDGFVANEKKSAGRLKRGGGAEPLPLDFEDAEGELRRHEIPDAMGPEDLFRREWIRSLFADAVDALREHCRATGREINFALFQRYDLEEVPGKPARYADLSAEFSLSLTQVTNHLAAARREFRRLVLERLREVTGSEEEFVSEARDILGVDPE